jgi:hypothetical protein
LERQQANLVKELRDYRPADNEDVDQQWRGQLTICPFAMARTRQYGRILTKVASGVRLTSLVTMDSAGGTMDVGTLTSILAIVVSVAAFIVSGLVANRQLRLTQISNETAVALNWLTRELISEEFLASEAYVLDRLRNEEPARGVSGLSPGPRSHVLRVGRYYASLGHLVVFGAVNEVLILSTVHYRLRRAWEAIEPFAKVERETRGNVPFFAFFEHIAARAGEVDVPGLHRRLKLRAYKARLGPLHTERKHAAHHHQTSMRETS